MKDPNGNQEFLKWWRDIGSKIASEWWEINSPEDGYSKAKAAWKAARKRKRCDHYRAEIIASGFSGWLWCPRCGARRELVVKQGEFVARGKWIYPKFETRDLRKKK